MRKGWEYKKLNEVCEKGASNIVINKLTDNSGEYPLFGASGLVKNIDFFHQDKPYIGIVKDGAGVGRVNIYPAYSSLVGTMQYIFPKEGYSIDFIKYFLVKLDLSHCVSGATIPHIYFKDYGKENIPTPSLDTQLAIVSELDKINELIRLKKEQLKDFDNLAQSIFYEMFGDPVENEMGWEVSTYSKCFNIGSGGTPSKSVPEYWDNGNIPWIGSNMCQNCIITETDGKFITQEGLNNSSTKYLEVGTVLVALVGATIGKVALLRTPTCTNQNVAFIKANESKDFVPEYVFYNLMGQYEEFMKIGKGNFKMANQAFIKALPILSPPLPLQQLFAHRIEQIEHQKAEVQKAITDLETLLASRMQYWFE